MAYSKSLDKRIRIYFSFAIALTLGLFIFSFFIFRSVLIAKDQLINDHVARVGEFKELEIYLGREVARNRAYVISGDKSLLVEGQLASKEFAKHLAKIKELDLGTRGHEYIDAIERARANFIPSEKKLISIRTTHPLAAVFVEEIKPFREAITQAVSDAAAYEMREFSGARAAVDQKVKWGTRFFMTVGFVAIILGFLFFWLFSKSVLQIRKGVLDLERSNKELEEFAGVAAHDLRAPLKTMRTWLDILDFRLPKPRSHEVETAMSFVVSNTKKACALIEDLLAVARINVSNVKMQFIDLNEVVFGLKKNLRFEIEKRGATISLDENLPVVWGNPNYLELVFSNLIRNALTYVDGIRKPHITIGCRKIPGGYEFFVCDNGIGIEPKYHEKIFDMFSRLHSESEYPGTGIGLAFCKKVVELYGGKIWVHSQPGKGSIFYFSYFSPQRKEVDYGTRYYDS